MTHVAFLGLGAIGTPMARHLATSKFDLSIWNRTADRARSLAQETGARHSLSIGDAVKEADVVITCLPSSREVELILNGAGGLHTQMKPGSALIDCTSGDPATSRRIARQMAERDIGFLDAPVSGGVAGAVQAALTVMVGGSAELLERVRPVLECFSKRIVHCGDIGAGDAVKAVNNALLAMHIWGTAEGLVALEKAGVRADVALDVINASSGRSNASMNLIPERVLTRAFPRTFKLALLDKDVGIAADFCREQKSASPLIQLTAELFRMAHSELGEEADHVEATLMIERLGGAQIGGQNVSHPATGGVS